MTGFEPGSSGIRCDRSANYATTTDQERTFEEGGKGHLDLLNKLQ